MRGGLSRAVVLCGLFAGALAFAGGKKVPRSYLPEPTPTPQPPKPVPPEFDEGGHSVKKRLTEDIPDEAHISDEDLALARPAPGPLRCWKEGENYNDWRAGVVDAIVGRGYGKQNEGRESVYVQSEINGCWKKLPAEARACMANLQRFSIATTRVEDFKHWMNFDVPDAEYFDRKQDYKDLLELPREMDTEFFKLLQYKNEAGWKKLREKVDAINAGKPEGEKWLLARGDSMVPSPEQNPTNNRVYIIAQNKNFDRLMQISVPSVETAGEPLPGNIQMLAIQKTDPATGKELERNKMYPKGFMRQVEGEKRDKIVAHPNYKVGGAMRVNCYECHKGGPIWLHPDEYKRGDPFSSPEELKAINNLIESYREKGPVDFVGYDDGAYGPPLGPKKSDLREDSDFMLNCTKPFVSGAKAIGNVKAAMNCTMCHNANDRGPMNFLTGIGEREFSKVSIGSQGRSPLLVNGILNHVIVDYKRMPPDRELDQEERRALVNCLLMEYYEGYKGKAGLLKQWLLEKKCPDNVAAKAKPERPKAEIVDLPPREPELSTTPAYVPSVKTKKKIEEINAEY